VFPQVLCFTELHLKEFEINNTCTNNCNLGAFYCRKTRKFGGVGIFVHDTLSCPPIDLTAYCNEQELEACALKFKVLNKFICILCIYRPPKGNFGTFIYLLESLLNKLYTISTNTIICGDVKINYLRASNYKTKLNSLLAKYNLHSAINFPLESPNTLLRLLTFFMNKINSNYSIESFINSLSDCDTQILVLQNINPSAWGHLNPSSYCDVGRLFYGVFQLWSKLQRKK